MAPERLTHLDRHWRVACITVLAAANATLSYVSCFEKTPQHTSRLSGQQWIEELIAGHDTRFYNKLGMQKFVFRSYVMVGTFTPMLLWQYGFHFLLCIPFSFFFLSWHTWLYSHDFRSLLTHVTIRLHFLMWLIVHTWVTPFSCFTFISDSLHSSYCW